MVIEARRKLAGNRRHPYGIAPDPSLVGQRDDAIKESVLCTHGVCLLWKSKMCLLGDYKYCTSTLLYTPNISTAPVYLVPSGISKSIYTI